MSRKNDQQFLWKNGLISTKLNNKYDSYDFLQQNNENCRS